MMTGRWAVCGAGRLGKITGHGTDRYGDKVWTGHGLDPLRWWRSKTPILLEEAESDKLDELVRSS